jgi:hypothetical protein
MASGEAGTVQCRYERFLVKVCEGGMCPIEGEARMAG